MKEKLDFNSEKETSCTVYDRTPHSKHEKISFIVRQKYTVGNMFKDVATQFPYESFELKLETSDPSQEPILLNDKKDKLLCEIPGFVLSAKNRIILMDPKASESVNTEIEKKICVEKCENQLSSGTDQPEGPVIFNSEHIAPLANEQAAICTPIRPSFEYVGLVNQAMTCYLNSLLQALFMTPEFRNALYRWEFETESKSIPYQLQKLFLNLQTSTKVAVETTELTHSFGWNSSEAWEQHDIQELCRVMFDALEQKFKGTEQANLINKLYEGKMIDYVKCLECCTEKSREDTFLDIPLPVRPFGSAVAYGSVEEALRAFVQPETLEGNNQYFCENCSKKCDAHKGLKFKIFPYILTLHLKRFDFDYQTLHRIKLNDKVTFPEFLDLNGFVNSTNASGTFAAINSNGNVNNIIQTNGFVSSSASSEQDNTECAAKCDDCSTTDSGAALEDDNYSGITTTASSSHHENDLQDDDEGIDVGSMGESKINHSDAGPFIYELFAIMIHSGSASGGHYYAYIKEFDNGQWYCFNDQSVTTITQEDIRKSYGGAPFRAYYSGVYSSSTNAYMLMYRQSDPKRNETSMKADEFPEYIKKLLENMQHEQKEKRTRVTDDDIIKPKVYFYNTKLKQLREHKVYVSKSLPLEHALESAYGVFDVKQYAPISRCRLIAYDSDIQEIECSLEDKKDMPIGDILDSMQSKDFLLEIRDEKEDFEVYEPGGFNLKIFKTDIKSRDVDGPYIVRALVKDNVDSFKKLLKRKLQLPSSNLVVALATSHSNVILLKEDEKIYQRSKVFVACLDSPPTEEVEENFRTLVEDSLAHLTYLYISVPNTDEETLDILSIPKYKASERIITNGPSADVHNDDELNFKTPKQSPSEEKNCEVADVVDAVMLNGNRGLSQGAVNNITGEQGCGDYRKTSPLPPLTGTLGNTTSGSTMINGAVVNGGGGHESNSEDSSLSDGDRTLVEYPRHDSSQVSSTSHSPQLSSPEDENGTQPSKKVRRSMMRQELYSEEEEEIEIDTDLYFRCVEITKDDYIPLQHYNRQNSSLTNGNLSDSEDNKEKVQYVKTLKVIVDKKMKIGSLKRALESQIEVPAEYFKILKKHSEQSKLDRTKTSQKLLIFDEGEQLRIELGRNLRKGECKAKIHYLRVSELNDDMGKLPVVCDWIFKIGMPVIDAKHELIIQLRKINPKYKSLTIETCRLWEKSGRNPVRILPDDQQLGTEQRSLNDYELVVQECENGANPSTSEGSLTLFVRKWSPSTLSLGPFKEITLEKDQDIRKTLASISDIPEENIAYFKVNGSFPCTNISVLSINTTIAWFNNSATTENYPLLISQNGSVYFYKNNTETPKALTEEERVELNQKEKARLKRIGAATTSLYSPRKERALKIYLEK